MGKVTVPSNVEELVLSARVIRADGTVEELGTVAYYHKNPIRRLARTLKRKVDRWHSA